MNINKIYANRVSYLMKKIEIQIRIYQSEDHPEVAHTKGNIAYLWGQMGEYQRAINQYEGIIGRLKKEKI